jgi:hypothetical protein
VSDLIPIVVDLNTAKQNSINESWLSMFGGAVEMMLRRMFHTTAPLEDLSYTVRGTPSQIASFGDALAGEKKYMEAFMTHGLNDPRSFHTRHELEKAVANFERETNLKWPFT